MPSWDWVIDGIEFERERKENMADTTYEYVSPMRVFKVDPACMEGVEEVDAVVRQFMVKVTTGKEGYLIETGQRQTYCKEGEEESTVKERLEATRWVPEARVSEGAIRWLHSILPAILEMSRDDVGLGDWPW